MNAFTHAFTLFFAVNECVLSLRGVTLQVIVIKVEISVLAIS